MILNALPQNYKNIVQIMTTLDMFSSIENLSSKPISKKNNKETLISESLGIPSKNEMMAHKYYPLDQYHQTVDFHGIFYDPNIGFITCGMFWERIKMKMWKLVSYFAQLKVKINRTIIL